MMRRWLVTLALPSLLLSACQSDGLTSEQKAKLLENYTETAQQYYQMGELDRAQGQAVKGLELDPKNEKLRMIQAWSMVRRGRTEDVLAAERIFRDVTGSGDYRATLGLGTALERKGAAYEESAAKIRTGKRVTEAADPVQRADEFDRRAHVCWTESLEWYAKTLELHKDDSDALNGSMRVHALLGDREKSLVFAERLIDVTASDYTFWEQSALRPDISASEERRIRDIARQFETVRIATYLHASSLLYELGRNEEALAHLDQAIAMDPEQAQFSSRRAQILKDLGRYEDAIQEIETFIKRSDKAFDHPDIQRAWSLRRECELARAGR